MRERNSGLKLVIFSLVALWQCAGPAKAQPVSSFYTNFTVRRLIAPDSPSLVPNSTLMGLGSAWTRSQWNSADKVREGPPLPTWFYNYDYISGNFDAFGQFGGAAANVRLSEFSDLLILGGANDQIVISNDAFTPWGGNDVVIGGAGDDRLLFRAECGGPEAFDFVYVQDLMTNELDGYNGIHVEITRRGSPGSIRVYGVEGFYFAATGELRKLHELKPPDRPPVILVQPQSQTVEEGGSLYLSASVARDMVAISFPDTNGALWLNSPQYQWRKDGVDLQEGGKVQGSRTLNLRLYPVAKSDAGEYTLVSANSAGIATASTAKIVVFGSFPEITLQPQGRNVLAGTSLTLSVGATGRLPLAYQWYLNESTPIAGATAATLSVPAVRLSEQGRYSVRVQNSLGTVTSATAQVQIVDPPLITVQPVSASVPIGGSVSFSVTASGFAPLSYQWFGTEQAPIAGATASSLLISNVQIGSEGLYFVRVANEVGTVSSQLARLSVIQPPRVRIDPSSVAVSFPGQAVTLRAVLDGAVASSFQWYFNGAPLPGATEASLTLPNLQPAGAGRYWVVAANAAGETRSNPAAVEIRRPEVVATHAIVGNGYRAGGTLTVENRLDYTGAASALSWTTLLPAGWTLSASSAGGVALAPKVGAGLVEWSWPAVPTSPVLFSYTLQVPASATGPAELVALVGVRLGDALQFLAQPDPLPVSPLLTHSADLDANFRIGLLELTRVIELYNTRHAGGRTGAYAVAAVETEDGFAGDATRPTSAVVSLTRYHSADSNRDGRIGLLELTRVIELYNYRSAGSRTGQYKLRAGTEDGFDPGP